MAEYINREAFIESQQNIYCVDCKRRKNSKGKVAYSIGDAPCRACGIMDVLDAVEDFPAADVRPVVLCRDCKMASPCSDDREMYCTLNHCYKTTNYFCADGRKKNENPN